MWEISVAFAIVAPPILIGLWLVLRAAARADEKDAQALIARLHCPQCGARPLTFHGGTWGEDVLYDDREESTGGYVLRCPLCDHEFRFTFAGELHQPTKPE
jgi:hypothetical protein